jgi:hypothetical protein
MSRVSLASAIFVLLTAATQGPVVQVRLERAFSLASLCAW